MRRVAVVGYGGIGRHHARNLASLDDVSFLGIVDSNKEAREIAASQGFTTFATIDEVLQHNIDAVILSVPTSLHRDYALRFIDASVAVLVEKPIADDVASGQEIIEAAAAHRIPLMVGYVERYNPAVVAIREFMQSGHLGSMFSISARRLGTMPARVKDANVLIDIGVHDIDLVAFITERTLELRSALGGKAILEDRIDFASIALDAAGISVHIDANWITPVKIRDLFVTGSNGVCHVDYVTQSARFAAARDFLPVESFEKVVEQYRAGEFIDLKVQREEPLRRELCVFLAGLDGEPLPDPVLSLISLKIAREASALIETQMALTTC